MTNQPFAIKPQQCNVVGLAMSFVAYFAGLIFFFTQRHWIGGLLWLAVTPCLRWAVYRYFPLFSRFLGYGRVDDQLPAHLDRAAVAVRFYSFLGCPFCPIVLQRLEALQKQMGFTLERIDATLQPQMLIRKGIRTVPVVEVGDRRLVGNATSEVLAAFVGLLHPVEPSRAA